MRLHAHLLAVAVAIPALSCLQPLDGTLPAACIQKPNTAASVVPNCLYARRIISSLDRDSASHVLEMATELRDSLLHDTSSAALKNAQEVKRALDDVTQFYGEGLFGDSARFDRILDHVLVTLDDVRNTGIEWINGRAAPDATPYLIWVRYDAGLFFQPVSTVQAVAYLGPHPWESTDSMLHIGDNLYGYALWRDVADQKFPVWEYEFPFGSGGVTNQPPWISGLAQGYAMMLFGENYRRTGDPKWEARAYEVLKSFQVFWGRGGVLLPDTLHGYWWEEFSPDVRIWNGAAQNVMAVGFLWQDTGDSTVLRIFNRGIEGLKYNTWRYDTGSWTLYSLRQGYNTVAYHIACYQILNQLYALSGDSWFQALANRWRNYIPPPGVN